MSDSTSLRDRYLQLIDEIVQTTLKGQIRSKEQVYQMLLQGVSPGTGEIFELCLDERFSATQQDASNRADELKQAKATRILRAIQTIRGEWERAAQEKRVSGAIAKGIQTIITAEPAERLAALLRTIDPNQPQPLNLQQLAKDLQQQAQINSDSDIKRELEQLSEGLTNGVGAWIRLQDHLVSWMYEQSRGPLGFAGTPEQRGPWSLWAKQVNSPVPEALFKALALNQSVVEVIGRQRDITISSWVELAVILQYLQRGLVTWFEKQAYDTQAGPKLSISTFLTFAAIWSQLADAFNQSVVLTSSSRERLKNGCFQVTLQILRTFSQQPYFPLYGGIFALLSGDYLRNALSYLDEPLRRVEGTQEKARILTLLGFSHRVVGLYKEAIAFHEQALEIARTAKDVPCEIANLNHLSRTYVAQKNYESAISYSQRALILSRQSGERLGEANALANLGYSEVFQARQLEQVEPEVYESAINYLEQGLQLSERLGDGQSQSLCCSSLGIALLVVEKPQEAIKYLEAGVQAAQFSGDLYLQGLNLANLAEAHYNLQSKKPAIFAGCLGMYFLEQIASNEWRQPAGLLTILQGQMGVEFQLAMENARSQIIPIIGVDGYDHIRQLLEQYQRSIE